MKPVLCVALLALTAAACDESAASHAGESAMSSGGSASLFFGAADAQWRLPNRLREISGLAVTADGRLFGHDDEVGVLYELSIADGGLGKSFSVGAPVARADFEGLAITPDGDFYLITSRGRLYRFREGADDAHVDFESFKTGLRDVAEVEGLTYLPSERSLIIACKTMYERDMSGIVALYAWSETSQELRPWATVPLDRVADAVGAESFHPSGVEIDPDTGRIVIVAARERALVELDRRGEVLAARRLGENHIQAEGVAIMPDGALIIADEGGDGRALVSRYPRTR